MGETHTPIGTRKYPFVPANRAPIFCPELITLLPRAAIGTLDELQATADNRLFSRLEMPDATRLRLGFVAFDPTSSITLPGEGSTVDIGTVYVHTIHEYRPLVNTNARNAAKKYIRRRVLKLTLQLSDAPSDIGASGREDFALTNPTYYDTPDKIVKRSLFVDSGVIAENDVRDGDAIAYGAKAGGLWIVEADAEGLVGYVIEASFAQGIGLGVLEHEL